MTENWSQIGGRFRNQLELVSNTRTRIWGMDERATNITEIRGSKLDMEISTICSCAWVFWKERNVRFYE